MSECGDDGDILFIYSFIHLINPSITIVFLFLFMHNQLLLYQLLFLHHHHHYHHHLFRFLISRKLTPQEAAAKRERKIIGDKGGELSAVLFRIESLRDAKQRFKVNVNATQYQLVGRVGRFNEMVMMNTIFFILHSSFIIHHSSFIIHHSSFIIHHSSITNFIIHHSPITNFNILTSSV